MHRYVVNYIVWTLFSVRGYICSLKYVQTVKVWMKMLWMLVLAYNVSKFDEYDTCEKF
jgi:hypothetical protein